MALERMSCCGALTHVYRDQGHRRHNPGCRYHESNYCGETNQLIDYGKPCTLLKGHEAADMPHLTENGLWWY